MYIHSGPLFQWTLYQTTNHQTHKTRRSIITTSSKGEIFDMKWQQLVPPVTAGPPFTYLKIKIINSTSALWSALVSFGQLWPAVVSCGQLCSALISSDQLWSALIGSDKLWSALVSFGQLWSTLVSSGRLLSALIGSGQLCMTKLRNRNNENKINKYIKNK